MAPDSQRQIANSEAKISANPWWHGGALTDDARGLLIGGQPVAELATRHGTPLYVCDGGFVRAQIQRLQEALGRTGKPFRIYYAMKANRHGPLLNMLRGIGDIGIDACSPREVKWVTDIGFSADRISVTASALSNRDLKQFVSQGVHLNLDTDDAVRRYAAVARKGTAIGLRFDPATTVGYGNTGKLNYGGGKLGLEATDVPAVARLAQSLGLRVDTLHMHLGWGLTAADEPELRRALQTMADLCRQLPAVKFVNVGGGLGARLQAGDRPMDPLRWGALIGEALAGLDVTVCCEPGTFLVSQAGILVSEVTSVWRKRGHRWAGLDAGLGINVYAAHYAAPLSPLAVQAPRQEPAGPWNLAGAINEAADVLGREVPLPELQTGDLLALYPAGAYGSSMASDHCLRGKFAEVLVNG